MSNKINKPKMSSQQLISKLKNDKGITFKYTSEKEAELYLQKRNNYMRTAAYRKNYKKHESGMNKGKYINLDFAYLQELSTIDMHLRFLISKMCLDIEHDLKVKLINDIENNNLIDGYDIVEQFVAQNTYIKTILESKSSSPYTYDLMRKYFTLQQQTNANGKTENKIISVDCPSWVLVELITFGEFIKFYEFYYNNYSTSGQQCIPSNIINIVKSLRNGCAHNNCIIANLSTRTSRPPMEISQAISKIPSINKSIRKKKLSCRPILEFTCMLYVYNIIVSDKVKHHRIEELKKLFHIRMKEKGGFFKNNELITSSFDFVEKVIDHFFK
ncbi:Abi family protein [Ruminiclostridium herbifermentans]|uniref:Abi family protein n=1 Tax=Ruminiclostridium herbifermentans TaxID=2488810 RepID=A0A4U7JF39_9FIRM|nr:Abi family protein [Ruminiclostridium herbifermentans]QNU67372.1 Abi family protein [Ruminiclostridium herbifermentans]